MMRIDVEVTVNAPQQDVWQLVCDIEHSAETIEGIEKIEVLESPDQGLVGLKWRETRTIFGKTATETMWITEAGDDYYLTEALNHGMRYRTRLHTAASGSGTRVGIMFEAEALTTAARIMSILFRPLMTRSVKKALHKDLLDVKAVTERSGARQSDRG
jgi:hypothetical protein